MRALRPCSAQQDRKMVESGEDVVPAGIFPDDRQGSSELSRAAWRAAKTAAERGQNRLPSLFHNLRRVIP
jgi:hypothetical protein